MRKYIVILFLCILTVHVFGQRTIRVHAENAGINKLYVCEVVNEYRGIQKVIDSAVVNNGQFLFTVKDSRQELLFIGDSPWRGGYFFLDGDNIALRVRTISDERIDWQVEGSPLDEMYRNFNKQLYQANYGAIRDSLDALFYLAREAGNREEMARLKEESIPYYEKGREKEQALVDEYILKNKENPFGMYLYYFRVFQHKDFPTMECIAAEKEYLNGFGEEAKNTSYVSKIEARLAQYENCAIGHVAPEIVGRDTLGNVLNLSDFRGSYVIVDFWDSYCHWCREETPALRRALERFKDKNFRILGVSGDRDKSKWMAAIHEDGSYWDHLLLERGNDVMDRYCIKGIPHIILVGPDGTILAKELRGEDLINVPEKFIK